MAYSEPILNERCRCGKPSRVEVFNRVNALVGRYCARCGAQRVKELNAAEQDADNRKAFT